MIEECFAQGAAFGLEDKGAGKSSLEASGFLKRSDPQVERSSNEVFSSAVLLKC
jgi:hypothetical protein